ncbi:FecCD family ABC transporter permease [Erwinia sp. V71]|uniref:FecCD family ABC transporter permease n=1 Tax=Erwinia sp. V71 TaxID=3369424 RepID=UPI003F62E627
MHTLTFGRVCLPFSGHFLRVFSALILLLMLLTTCALWLGTSEVTPAAFLRWLLSPVTVADAETSAIMQLRLPRVAVALLGGAMIAASGYLLQVVADNGLADPGLLGISQGTSVAVLLTSMLTGLADHWLALAGLAGGLSTGTLVIALAFRFRSNWGLILIGLGVSVSLSAMVELIMASGGIVQFSRYISWAHGSLTAVSMEDVWLLIRWALVLFLLLLLTPRLLAPLRLSSDQASALGARPQLSRPLLILLASALVAPVVAVAGPMAFVGLIASHLARRLVSDRPGELLPVAMLTGALLMLCADMAGRTLFLPVIMPAGLLVSLCGIPAFLLIARLTRRKS